MGPSLLGRLILIGAALLIAGCSERFLYGAPTPSRFAHERTVEPSSPAVHAVSGTRFNDAAMSTCNYTHNYSADIVDLGGCLPTSQERNRALLWMLDETAEAGGVPYAEHEIRFVLQALGGGLECRSYDRNVYETRTDPAAVVGGLLSLETSPRNYELRQGCRQVRAPEEVPDWTSRSIDEWAQAARRLGFDCIEAAADRTVLCRVAYLDRRSRRPNPDYFAENPGEAPAMPELVGLYHVETDFLIQEQRAPQYIIRSVEALESDR
jgi:hypothetical protein